MKHIITSVMIVVLSVTSAFAGVHEDNWVHGFRTFETTDGDVYADRDEDGVWDQIDGQTGAILGIKQVSDLYLLETMSGRLVETNQYYWDSKLYVGDEIQAAIDREAAYKAAHEWDYFWGTTMNPTLNGWNDFWGRCQNPESTHEECVAVIAAGIGVAIGGLAVIALGTVAVLVAMPVAGTGGGLALSTSGAWGFSM